MFPARAFAPRYFAARYWPKVGDVAVVVPPVVEEVPLRSQWSEYPLKPWVPPRRFAELVYLIPGAVLVEAVSDVRLDVRAALAVVGLYAPTGMGHLSMTRSLAAKSRASGVLDAGAVVRNPAAMEAQMRAWEADARERDELELLGL